MTEEIGTEREVIAFISASFDDSAQKPINWFIEMAKSLGIKTIWLKEKYETRPIEDKIKDNLKKCNAFIQILTEDIERESKDRGWLGNEYLRDLKRRTSGRINVPWYGGIEPR